MTREETWQRLVELGGVKGDKPEGPWDLSGVDLPMADLKGANLAGVNLSGANLNMAKLDHANLSGANLIGAYLSGAILRKAEMKSTSLGGADLMHADLRDSDLTDARLHLAYLLMAKLDGAIMKEAALDGANLTYAGLSGADLRGADLSSAIMIETHLEQANLRRALLIDTNLNRANLSAATLTGAVFYGCSTAGWKIDDIKVEYLYLTGDVENKEKHIRHFPEGKFEELYRSLPTIELIFEQGLSPIELLKLSAVIEEVKQRNPELDLNMSRMTAEKDAARVEVQMGKAEDLQRVAELVAAALKDAERKGIPVQSVLPEIIKLLPFQDAKGMLSTLQDRNIPVNLFQNCMFIMNSGDGTYAQALGAHSSAHAGDTNIIHNYQAHIKEVDAIMAVFRESLQELGGALRDKMEMETDRLVEALREGKDAGRAQEIWNQIKEGVKTGGSIASITSAVAALARFLG